MTEPTMHGTRQRMDPFQLPAATTSRFLLLTVLTLSATAYTAISLVGGSDGWNADYRACMTTANAGTSVPPEVLTRTYVDCFRGVNLEQAAIGLGAAILLAAMLLIGYLLHPRWLIWRQGLRPFDPAVFPAAAQTLDRLVAEAGLERAPWFMIQPFRDSIGGRAFGRRGRYHVRLNLGLLNADERVFRAVVRHELAHIRNRDVGRTIVTILSGRVFGIVAILQLVTAAVVQPSVLWDLSWRLAVIGVLVWLVRASVIRAREHYADVRASTANLASGEDAFLVDAFNSRHPRLLRLGFLRMHPSIQARTNTVWQPDILMRAGLVEALATGATVGVIQPYLTNLGTLVFGTPLYGRLIPALILGAFTVTVVGTSLWRDTLRALVTRTGLSTGAAAGLLLAVGILAGQVVSAMTMPTGWLEAVVREPLQGSLAIVALCGICVIYCRWAAGTAAAWLSTSRRESYARTLWLGQVIAALGFGAALGVWTFAAGTVAQSGDPWALTLGLFIPYLDPIAIMAVLAAVMFPLVAAGRSAGRARQVWLDTPDEVLLPRPRLRPWSTLVPPIAVFVIALVLEHWVLPRGLLVPFLEWVGQRSFVAGSDLLMTQSYGFIALLAVIQLVVGVVVGIATARRDSAQLAPAQILVATALTGILLVVAFVVVHYIDFCSTSGCEPYRTVLGFASSDLAIGVFALVTATAVAVVVGLVSFAIGSIGKRAPRWPASSDVVAEPRRLWARRVALTVGALIVLIYAVPVATFWLRTNELLPGTSGYPVPEGVRNAPPPGPPGSATVEAACRQGMESTNRAMVDDQIRTTNMQVGLQAAATESPAMRAFGQVLVEGTRQADDRATDLALSAITIYCRSVPLGPATPAPPPPQTNQLPSIVAFGQTYRWPDGEAVSISAPRKESASLAAVDVTITNNSSQPLRADLFVFAGMVDLKTVELGAEEKLGELRPGEEITTVRTLPWPQQQNQVAILVAHPKYGTAKTAGFIGEIAR